MDDVWTKIIAWLAAFFDEGVAVVLTALMAGAKSVHESGGALLISAAEAAVTAAESDGGPGSAKFAQAVDAVKGTLQSQGVTIVENAVRLAVEAAVAKLRADTAK